MIIILEVNDFLSVPALQHNVKNNFEVGSFADAFQTCGDTV
jgi:hypothetical protein